MNKSAIKGFSVRARRKLIEDISQKAYALGIKGTGKYDDIEEFEGGFRVKNAVNQIIYPPSTKKDREKLIAEINRKGFEQVVEEVAYTWFNRIIAIRFMEINEYLPVKVRILSSEVEGKTEPDVITHIYDYVSDLELDSEKVFNLKENHKDEELFKYIFVKVCNNLGKLMPQVFEAIGDYTELLLPDQLLSIGSVIRDLIEKISEEDYKYHVEIIGWLYQYYNEEKKNEVININKGDVEKNDIPAATQLFTTKWIVKYMVDNSLGRYWVERNPHSNLKDKLEFFINDNSINVNEHINPEDIRFLDPCMGSGHILVYAFEVLMLIYEERGYRARDAALLILEKNIHGLDIDDRAGQLSIFSLLMMARKYNRKIFDNKIIINVCSIRESNYLESFEYGAEQIIIDDVHKETANYLIKSFRDAKEIGSIVDIDEMNYDSLQEYLSVLNKNIPNDLLSRYWFENVSETISDLIKQAKIMSRKYDVVVTNPPYLNKYSTNLKKYVLKHFNAFSGDLFSVFIARNIMFSKTGGYCGYMTPFLWMFIKKYEDLRNYIVNSKCISSFIQLEYSAFEEATVPICTFVIRNDSIELEGTYIKLTDFKGGMEHQEVKALEAIKDSNVRYCYRKNSRSFVDIPGTPLSFWASDDEVAAFKKSELLSDISSPRQGLITGDVRRFVRLWFECSSDNLNLNSEKSCIARKGKWFPYNNGGAFRKWYGNNEDVVNWQDDGFEVKNFKDSKGKQRSRPQNEKHYFEQGATWTAISSGAFSVRYFPEGYLFSNAGMAIYANESKLKYIIGFLNSKLCGQFLSIFNEGLNYNQGDIAKLPIIYDKNHKDEIVSIVNECIEIAKFDWDLYEISWDFKTNPIVKLNANYSKIHEAIINHEYQQDKLKARLIEQEQRLNELFIKIYSLNRVINNQIEDKSISISKRSLVTDMKDLISYAVGCMLGRYTLDQEGLCYYGGQFESSMYSIFKVSEDNILLISEDNYFRNDIINRFVEFIKVTFGEDNLEENLKYIAEVLNPKSKDTPRQTIRNYFVKEFYNDHVKMYKNRPIYWMIDSGKQNGIKALFYMHRYDKSTIAMFRTDYLHEIQRYYENDIELTEKSNDKKKLDNLKKKLQEVTEFDKVVAHIAHQQIEFDLDDGVDHNYELFQGVEVPQGDGQKPMKANLLAKRK